MTKVVKKMIRCSKCGKESEQLLVFSVNYLLGGRGSNDNLLNHKQKCPYCGYEAVNISKNDSSNYINKLKREKLVELTEEFMKQTDNFEIFKIPDELYLEYFAKLENTFREHSFEIDDRFVTYGRLDFLREEVSQRLNDEKLRYEESNSVWGKNKWDNRMGAFIDLWDYIRGDRWFTPTNIPEGKDFKEVLLANDKYYEDGFICKQEKDILLEIISEIKEFIVGKNTYYGDGGNNVNLFSMKNKYDIDPENNVPREVYGIPSPLKKEIDEEKDNIINPNVSFDKNDKESINIMINNYCLSLTKWSNKCDILYMDKSKENFIKDSIITVPLSKFDEFIDRLNRIIVFWNNEYSGNNGVEWKIKVSTKSMNKNIIGNGRYPHNWNEFIDLISSYEILFKKTIIYDKKNEEKLEVNTSFEKVVEKRVKDPFFTRLICEYFKDEIKKSDIISKLLFEDVSRYNDIFNEFTRYLVRKSYDLPNLVGVEGYTAKQIAELNPNFKAIEVYTFLNYLRDKPEEAKDIIKKGFPNKDVMPFVINKNI